MIEDIFSLAPYSLKKEEKSAFLLKELKYLTRLHVRDCKSYKNILEAFGYIDKEYQKLEDFFAMPVRLFKEYDISSSSKIFKTLVSSGTTSSKVSKIYLDAQTAQLQTKALVKIMQDFLGKKRLPMLLVESKSIIKNSKMFSARAAGVLGVSNFGRKHTYILDDDMKLNRAALEEFLSRYENEPILIFGFTFMVWKYFFKAIERDNLSIDLSQATLFHSGGWKKLQDEAVSNELFKKSFKNLTSLEKIHNFYGMVEQVGSIFVECEEGHLHTPNFADIIIRDTQTLEPLGFNAQGFIELISTVARSYAGHVLLSEDIGEVLGEDDCACGRMGKYFRVIGRVASAEVRGCSDTYEEKQ